MLDTLPAEVLFTASIATEGWPDSMETALRIMRALPQPRSATSRLMSSDNIKTRSSRILAMRGHVREALRTPPVHESATVFAGLLGILADDSVRAAMARSPGPPLGYIPMRWLAARRDTVALSALVRVTDSLARLPEQGTDRRRSATLNRQATHAYLALARRDTTAALRALEAVPDTLLSHPSLRLTRAQLLAASGRDREAAKVLDEVPLSAGVLSVLIELERARIAERLGDKPRATEGYRYVVGMWRRSDSELQPFVAEAREALGQLTAEPGGELDR